MNAIEVIIPCRNTPVPLWLTLTHLMAYGGNVVRSVTLVDNGSTDPQTLQILQQARHLGARVVRNESDVGVWASVNRGLATVRGRWAFVLTSDVLLGPSTLSAVLWSAEQVDVPFLGPEVLMGLELSPELLRPLAETLQIDTSTYNGAAWLMDWPRLRDAVGWFDPRFYVVAGDTDYIERMRLADLHYGVVHGALCVHLDKQTRRGEGPAGLDTDRELREMAAFHEKWAAYPEVLARHPLPDREGWNSMKVDWEAQRL